jgi:osmoprotectant transport system substrate-binding protein
MSTIPTTGRRNFMKTSRAGIYLFILWAAALFLGLSPALASKPMTPEKGPIVVGSKFDTEGSLLGEMIVELLQAHGFTVVNKTSLGPTDLVRKALLSGEIDIYPEYTGNGAIFFPSTNPDVYKNAELGYETVKKLDLEKNKIVWLQPAPADNTWGIAVTDALSSKNDIKSIADFARYVNGGGTVKMAVSEEFVTSPAALPTFQKAYGFTLSNKQLLILQSGNTAQTEKAAYDGTDGVNAAMAYGTDGSISAFNLVLLADPKHVEPVYEPCPIVREGVYNKYPAIATILDPVFKTLTTKTLQTLNGKIVVNGESASAVARQYLESNGILKK